MAKTVPPGTIVIPQVGAFSADALPDPFDKRDLEYRPRLEPLPVVLDQRQGTDERYVMRQDGNSCTGHALAAAINAVLARPAPAADDGPAREPYPHVSPYMLYRLARRYDEFAGDSDVGSSLRGGLKGWFNHGVLLEGDWPVLLQDPEPDLDDEAIVEKARERPLGAFYRVSPYRLDDMQSAISELSAICASAVVHEGWVAPVELTRKGENLRVIVRPANARVLGGHAFALVGYNEVGFLVQNSWGPDWGKGGFATLPYEDWLESAYDAWVARPGVPQTPFASGRSGTKAATGGDLATGPAPDVRRLAMHVVNLGNQGRLSSNGKFTSSPAQIERAFQHMQRWHELWLDQEPDSKRHVVLYAHGGLNSEEHALSAAQESLNWWLNNHLYPLFFAWESGATETLLDQLADTVKGRLPFGLGFDLVEQVDRLVERFARTNLRWMWNEMKENARAASAPIPDRSAVAWPPATSVATAAMMAMPGASLTVLRLRDYLDQHGPDNVAVHMVGHSAGAIFHAGLLQALAEAEIPVASLALLAPAIRVDEFARDVLPHLGPGGLVRSSAIFDLSDKRERDDVCGAGGIDVYHKSLLYLVSRALEGAAPGGEVPLLGMQKSLERPIGAGAGPTLLQAIGERGGSSIISRAITPDDSRSDATSHGGFAGDRMTMTSVAMRALGLATPRPENDYRPNAVLSDADRAPTLGGGRPVAPDQPGIAAEVAVAPRSGSPVLDVLLHHGWLEGEEP
jgi:hypothetical protein